MSTPQPQFSGSIPENYDRYLAPVFFQPFAQTMVARVKELKPSSVLELACGTGAVTRLLASQLPKDARLIATDLSQDMMAIARCNLANSSQIEWQVADACALPFEDSSFDVVTSQFGVMSFPDKATAFAEAHRVLSPGGHLVYSAWGELSSNLIFQVVEDTLTAMFPEEETPFMPTPFSMANPEVHRDLAKGAGFATVSVVEERLVAGPHTPDSLAAGFALGTPLGLYLSGKGYDLGAIRSGLAVGFAAGSKDPSFAGITAIVCHAIKSNR